MSSSDSGPALDPERWEQITGLFDRTAELPAQEQAGFVAAEAAGDEKLAGTVLRMLAADRADGDMLAAGVAPAAHLVLEPDAPLLPGDQVGAFDVVGELGRGGMGVVYAAVDRHLGRPAALKFLPPRRAGQSSAADQLIAEAKAASALDHPNVASVYQVGETEDGRRFIAMPRYDGETLRARLARGPVPPDEALRVAREVAAGLAAAHRAGIVHRDVSPANIFLTRDGPVKLLDFGIAVLTGSKREHGGAYGTVSSMSPEQARGEPADARSDVWSLGAVLFRMLTGDVPFPGASAADTLRRLSSDEAAPRLSGQRGVPRRMARVVDRALQKNAAERYPDAGSMRQALKEAGASRVTWRRAALAALPIAAIVAGAAVLRPLSEPLPAGPPTLVLAPVRSAGADSASVAMAAAIRDEVGRRLTLLGRVKVTTRDSAGGAPQDPAVHLFELTLGRAREAPQLEARVTVGDPPRAIWSESRRFDNAVLRALSRDLTDGVLRALGLTLSAREHAALAAGFPATAGAYRDFLAGNQLLRSRQPEDVLQAIARYRAAHEQDSAFVSALARHAYAISLLLDWGWTHPAQSREALLAEGVKLSGRALALDSASADAWLARAYLMVAADPRRMTGASDAFRQAIALDPYSAEAYHQYGQTAMQLGRLAEAATAYRRAIELEPTAAMSLVSLGGIAEIRGQHREALRLFDSAVAAAPEMAYARAIRSLVRSYGGDYAGARDDADAALELDTGFRLPGLAAMAMAMQGLGDSVAATRWLTAAEDALSNPHAPSADEAHMLANAQVALGRSGDAAQLVVRVRPRGAALWYLFLHPALDPVRHDSAAAAALAEADPRGSP